MNGHVQQCGKIRHRSTEAEGERDNAHVFNRRITEEPLDIALSPDEESAEHCRKQSKRHQHAAWKNVTDGTFDQHLATNYRIQSNIQKKTGKYGGYGRGT